MSERGNHGLDLLLILFFAHSSGVFCLFVHLSLFGLMYTVEWFSHFFLPVVMCFVIIMIILSFFLHLSYFSYGMICLYFSSAAEKVMLFLFFYFLLTLSKFINLLTKYYVYCLIFHVCIYVRMIHTTRCLTFLSLKLAPGAFLPHNWSHYFFIYRQ